MHDIGKLIDEDCDVGKRLWNIFTPSLLRGLKDSRVVRLDISDVLSLEYVIASFHFLCCPLEGEDSFLRVRNDRGQEMRNAIVRREFDTLRIDHDEAQLVRAIAIEQRGDESMNSDRLS